MDINFGCGHKKVAYNHCIKTCNNSLAKCPRHSAGGIETALCSLERAVALSGLSDETIKIITDAIEVNPVMEEAFLAIAESAYADGEDAGLRAD